MLKALAVALCFASLASFAEIEKTDQMAESLIKLRTDVEGLDQEVTQLREDQKMSLQTLKIQQGEMAASIEAEKLKRDQLKSQISEMKGQLSSKGFEDQQMKSTVLAAISELRGFVSESIPFQISKRTKELDELEKKINSDQITSVKAAIRLWSFVEDELRSATENSVFRQTVKISGKETLVEVAKLGSVFLFYKTNDDQYGSATQTAGVWSFEPIANSAAQTKVAKLFEALKKQIRTGQFEIPNQLQGRL